MTTIRGVANNGGGSTRKPSVNLDEVSKTIIELLQHDGRKSYASIAQEVGLSEAAVRQRVQRLLDADVMQIVAVTPGSGRMRLVSSSSRWPSFSQTTSASTSKLPAVVTT